MLLVRTVSDKTARVGFLRDLWAERYARMVDVSTWSTDALADVLCPSMQGTCWRAVCQLTIMVPTRPSDRGSRCREDCTSYGPAGDVVQQALRSDDCLLACFLLILHGSSLADPDIRSIYLGNYIEQVAYRIAGAEYAVEFLYVCLVK